MNRLIIEPVNEKVSNVISLSLTETVKNKEGFHNEIY